MLQLDPAFPVIMKRGIARGFALLWRERAWGISLGALTGVLLLVHMLLTGLFVMAAVQNMLTAQSDVRLEIRSDAARVEVQQFLSALKALPYVADASYITREQAYARASKEEPDLVSFLEKFGMGNPFPDTIGITLVSLEDYPLLSTFISGTQWQRVVDPTFLSTISKQEERMHELIRVAKGGRSLAILLLCITGSVLLSIIVELTRLRAFHRREEVLVQRLTGAGTPMIAVPFATEACILLWMGILASAAVITFFLLLLPVLLPALTASGALGSLREEAAPLLKTWLPVGIIIELLCAPLLASLGAWLGIRKDVRSPSLAK
ncbi:MAG: permease-like cell division protein FtsX [Candidatus Peribacteraceae bacterium]|nr:permease-like cell division protein FtsX [Candidatus Peribacteraceae bacterium]